MQFSKRIFSLRHEQNRRPFRPMIAVVFACFASACCSYPLFADVFQLENGGTVEGRLLNPSENPKLQWEIGLPGGIRVVLPSSCVVRHTAAREDDVEYETRRIDSPDTVEGHYALATWCLEKGMNNASREHHLRALALDPDYEPSRRALGYQQRNGDWTTREQFMENQGYVFYKSRWRLPQEALIDEQNQEFREREGQWRQDLRLWRSLLNGGRSAEAYQNILAVTDPIATGPLVEMLKEEKDERVRELYLKVLFQIDVPASRTAIMYWSVEEPLEDLRVVCYRYMQNNPQAVDFFTGRLYNSDPDVINEAAYVLRLLGDGRPVPDLITRLVTTHSYTRVIGSPGMGGTFDNRGGISMSQGTREETWEETSNNDDVLAALKQLTGFDFGFNVGQWRQWWRQQRELEQFRPRRDI